MTLSNISKKELAKWRLVMAAARLKENIPEKEKHKLLQFIDKY